MKAVVFFLLFIITPSAFAKSLLIHAGSLIDGVASTVKNNVSVRVKGNKIVSVELGFITPSESDELIDLSEHTLMPGLMDMHTHLSGEFTKGAYSEKFFLNPTDYALRSTVYAKDTLMAGFTTVRDLGELSKGVTVSLRNAINKGWVIGPRIYTAGKTIATTGGHADPTNGLNHELMKDPGPKEGVINSPEDAYKAIRQRYKEGADVIKLTVTGGVLSLAKSGDNPQFTDSELNAIMDAAKDYNFVVAVHAHGAQGMKRAIRAGVDSIEHGTFMDDEVINMMIEQGTWYVPTITAGKWVAEKAQEQGFYPEVVRPKASAVGPKIQSTFTKAINRGVKIAYGTDAGVYPHGLNAREFSYMVEAGMKPMDAIKSATINAATLLRVENKLGSIEVDKLADIVAVKGNPLVNIKLMENIAFVMKDGVVYKHAK
ncbi:amidohydrolase family protein [Catenovulum sp. SM1970]|uniref:metal-dependent hydrolase family protein n=1 Tax=Marinifaba aquimaris TaxID=2741323 RepID=UPI001571C103|nr:amidohydrolase family protein [Marinifaba aquimaris]NTS75378.1 amidohydrolase family protein [Marinifaba aquimaris]